MLRELADKSAVQSLAMNTLKKKVKMGNDTAIYANVNQIKNVDLGQIYSSIKKYVKHHISGQKNRVRDKTNVSDMLNKSGYGSGPGQDTSTEYGIFMCIYSCTIC